VTRVRDQFCSERGPSGHGHTHLQLCASKILQLQRRLDLRLRTQSHRPWRKTSKNFMLDMRHTRKSWICFCKMTKDEFPGRRKFKLLSHFLANSFPIWIFYTSKYKCNVASLRDGWQSWKTCFKREKNHEDFVYNLLSACLTNFLFEKAKVISSTWVILI